MSSAEVFCWGSLGPDPGEDNPVPVEAGRSGLVQHVHAGSRCALVATAKGVKWLPDQTGSSGNEGDDGGSDILLRNLPGVVCPAFGENHTLLLRNVPADEKSPKDGSETKTQVLAWGSGKEGQLGLGARILETKSPRAIPALSAYRVVQVACGAQHSAAVTSYGDLFTWGRGVEGQLGHESHHLPPELNDTITGIQLRPKPVPAFLATKKRHRPVAGVSCGVNFTLVVTRAGAVWAFGGGIMGQLGIGRLTCTGIPQVVLQSCPASEEPFIQVSAGWAHALARTSGGRVYSWGFNALGALGLGDHRTRFFPEVVPLGNWQRNSGHDDDEGTGSIGSGNVCSGVSSRKADVTAVKVHACGNRSGALTTEGQLLTWGCGMTANGWRRKGGAEISRPDKVEHVLLPQRVERFVGATVSDFAVSSKGGVALIPLHVQSIEPASGPLETGCKVIIKGTGFWDSPDIVVKFTPVSKGSKPAASRSAVGTYIPREVNQSHSDSGNGIEVLTCTAPCFASPDAVYVEVSVDGTSFTTDGVMFQYYRTPEVAQVTPDICRPPFPILRLDGEHFIASDTLMVRFEEDKAEEQADHEAGFPLDKNTLVEDSIASKALLPSGSPPRVFTVPGRVESEMIEVGIDPDTELPVEEERWFLRCDSPNIPPNAKLPFISRLTVAPNGADFNGEPLRFVAHDPHADHCLPQAVPPPPPTLNDGDEDDGVKAGEAEKKGPSIRITGRNLYGGTNLAIRIRCGLGEENVVPFHTTSFDAESDSIVGIVPVEAGELVPRDKGGPPAISVVIEVSVDGREYFEVPERLTLFRQPRLTLHGDGLFPVAGGGWAELKAKESTFRGHDAKVRLVSGTHGIDVILPLLSSPPVEEVEEVTKAPPLEDGGDDSPVPPPSAEANAKKPLPVKELEKSASRVQCQESCDSASIGTPHDSVWEEQEVSTSDEPFFFAVPPLPKKAQGNSEGSSVNVLPEGQEQDAMAVMAAAVPTPGEQGVGSKQQPASASSKSPGAGGEAQDAAVIIGPEEVNTTVNLLVSLNGEDWEPVLGPPLTYFPPPPEPEVEPEEEPKKGKGKKK